jgi:hypothetical protein
MNTTVLMKTPTCRMCGKGGTVEVDGQDYLKRTAGALIQDAFPNIAPPLREQMMSGTHPECWSRMFGGGM